MMNNTMFRMGTPKEKFRKAAIWVLKGGFPDCYMRMVFFTDTKDGKKAEE